ncbi:MAG TPA: ATP-binding protein [Chloroflexi bacterium]|nr:MAG: AAA family ATPase [Anaerolineaceae bacterium 4572_5.2]HEY84420.1 ATP-binding protein [Chloroflexota bacterium]
MEGHLKQLRLKTFIQNYGAFAQDAAQENRSYEQFLLALAQQETAQRDLNSQRQRIKGARFSIIKELADFDFSAVPKLNKQRLLTLAQGEYIARKEPIILVGNPGLGKTHIATGLGMAACRQRERVRFYNAASLVNELILAQEETRLEKVIATALRHRPVLSVAERLIVLDELGFIPFSAVGAQLVFQFVAALYERVAIIITTNLKFADWPQIFGDERLTLALLDRLTHRAHIIEFVGESWRFRQRMQREQGDG